MTNPLVIEYPDESVVTVRDEDEMTIITGPGGVGGTGRQFRGVINYDGGHAGTHYGDLIHLDGGGAADGSRYTI